MQIHFMGKSGNKNKILMFIHRNINFFRIITFLVLCCFTGCVTSRMELIEKDALLKDKVYRIAYVFLNDGSSINLKDREPVFKTKYKGKENVIVYYYNDQNEKYIEFKDIAKIKIEVLESNTVLNVMIIVGSVVLFFFILFLILGPPTGNMTG